MLQNKILLQWHKFNHSNDSQIKDTMYTTSNLRHYDHLTSKLTKYEI